MQQGIEQIAAQGQGNDSMLMHVTPGEVAGLDAIAASRGMPPQRNPVTGLPQAGWFETLAPMAVSMIPGVGLPTAAALSGGLAYARTGSLEQGLLAGLGTYAGGKAMQGLGEFAPTTTTPDISPRIQTEK